MISKIDIEEKYDKMPIIIGGCGRSGTTLMLSILSAHPEVFCIEEETQAFCPNAYSDNVDLNAPFNIDLLFEGHLIPGFDKSFKRWCEKTPKNILFFERIIDHFNNKVKLINIVRDGRDVILSKHPTKPKDFHVSVERWVDEVKEGMKYENNKNVYTIRYEDLVLNYKSIIGPLIKFLELESNDNMTNWYEFATVRSNVAWSKGVQPIFNKSVGKWQNTKRWKEKRRVKKLMKNKEAVELLRYYNYL